MQTSGRWSWKSKLAKECVITHLSNESILKMEGTENGGRYLTDVVRPAKCRRVYSLRRRFSARATGAANSADLGASSR
jgi:hypothetical protein